MKNKKHIHELYELYEEKMQKYLMADDTKGLRLKIIDKIEEIDTFLDDKQHQQLNELLELKNELSSIYLEIVFIYAYSLANTLMVESLSNNSIEIDS